MTDSDRIRITRAEGVVEIALNRPDKRNAWDMAMFDALTRAGEALAGEEGLVAVILHGAGGHFSAGLDMAMFAAMGADMAALRAEILGPPAETPPRANRFQRPCTVWAEVPAPVIAAVEGVAFGAGLQLALGADLRILAPDARLSVMEARWGLIPDMGISQTLPPLMPADRALDLILSAREVGAEEALAIGLATSIAPHPLVAARAMAAALAEVSPGVRAGAKRLVRAGWQGNPAALRLEAEIQAALIGSPDQMEAVAARLSRRPPRFG
ncbi:crotonase/enoyl-CoA hydratase family protein [Ruixingdingia sedimenti]|uniref:Crotonase/enoyl-CoA hydratase family protein n=1 Tax=Ruixingdingia sedimenti TaxID=3073604 RepID=A0ABU1FCF2_9RHOB|nr:crotonase/enoyl-CoA hydratase family protein [Xinfangfangia sp. LG-4]MDR5654550.1 crotonase/enoyl-CoA hydratase family protein [Xinfangfangia sp. LG-4]